MSNDNRSSIQFVPKGNVMNVRFGYRLMYNKDEPGIINYYIPGFNLFFSANDEETGSKRGKAMVRAFLDYWINQESPRSFILEIHKLGFRTKNHDLVMKEFLHKKITSSKFNSSQSTVPEHFNDGSKEEEEFELSA